MIRFYDEGSKEGIRFKREISKPQNAKFVFEGIEVERDSNTIDDLLKGMTLFIFEETDKEETLKIDRPKDKDLKRAVNDFKKEYIIELLDKNQWNQTNTARILGIQRTYLSKLIKELNIDKI